MEMLKVSSMEDVASLPLTKWNIPQPTSSDGRENPLTSGSGLDLILVPGLGFTEVNISPLLSSSHSLLSSSQTGLRIGRGKVS